MKATVYFAHGRESGPWGTKIRILAKIAEAFGCRVISLDDQDEPDPDQRVRRLIAHARDAREPLILAGSSMGGYVAAVAATTLQPRGLFLMAPAIGLPGYAVEKPQPVAGQMTIVHGWSDEVVPAQPVIDFAGSRQCHLCMLPDGHRLLDQLPVLARHFELFLERCLAVDEGTASRRLTACL